MRSVYYFGRDQVEGSRKDADLLGGKGANLAEMARLGIPVPPGFTISTDACRHFLREGQEPVSLRVSGGADLRRRSVLVARPGGRGRDRRGARTAHASALAAGVGLTGLAVPEARATTPTSPHARVAANEKLAFGLVGAKGMGWSNLQAHLKVPGVECAALCDVDTCVLQERAAELEKTNCRRPALYGDDRRMLENRDLDFVIIAAPDHWHCLQTVHACEAGKDVYVEKPLANSIAECQIMTRAAQRYGRVVQVGQWQRSNQHWQDAIDYVRSGKIGRVRLAKVWAYMGWMKSIPVKPDASVPVGVDYDMWLGPASARAFNSTGSASATVRTAVTTASPLSATTAPWWWTGAGGK